MKPRLIPIGTHFWEYHTNQPQHWGMVKQVISRTRLPLRGLLQLCSCSNCASSFQLRVRLEGSLVLSSSSGTTATIV